ncbi:hypothetical protein [Tepidimonas charontis]|uniref:Uncharacterized protein n=1 Tax=Tepidimonas charontis TaxID=2267262 RepID=A0A554XHG3_9BURK|nr:hypothetical protein [Tepidimonas charontis]TSE35270.1 hypothetical protein Tchar_00881 [Tepidimonas charontis]
MSTSLTSSPVAAPTRAELARRAAAPRALVTLLLAAGVAALAVVAERLTDTWADGHLLTAWILMWAVVFLGSVLLASPARHLAQRLMATLDAWARRRAEARAAARTLRLAQLDARLQAELHALSIHQESSANAQAWAQALAPLGSGLDDERGALREWVSSAAEQVTTARGRRYSLYYI